MILTQATRQSLAVRRQRRDLTAAGYEEVDDSGGRLWELNRGHRWGHRIVDVVIGHSGKNLFVKIEAPALTSQEQNRG